MSPESLIPLQSLLDRADDWVAAAAAHFAVQCTEQDRLTSGALDQHGAALLDLARHATALRAARWLLLHARHHGSADDPLLYGLAALYAAESAAAFHALLRFRTAAFGVAGTALQLPADEEAALATWLDPGQAAAVGAQVVRAGGAGDDGLGSEHTALRERVRHFAREKLAPIAADIHLNNRLLPDEVIDEMAALGAFGYAIPLRYGGTSPRPDGEPDHLAVAVASDELARVSLAVGGSVITRPELLTKALLVGGTEQQKVTWLPQIAGGRRMVGIAVTEPDHGSDVAGITTRADRVAGGWELSGTKIWSGFAGRADLLMVLARTTPVDAQEEDGLSLFVIEKPAFYDTSFEHRSGEGLLRGQAIPTIGYRGMHTFHLHFERYFVPEHAMIGGPAGEGRGYEFQMHGFAASRLQTAGRTAGVMQAALDEALAYGAQRMVFGQTLDALPTARRTLARMAAALQALRQLTHHAARTLDVGSGGEMEAAAAKLLAGRSAEWVTREAQQLHGGRGYARDARVARLWLDARVLAIFEGAEEVLAIRVVARELLRRHGEL